MTAEQGNIPIAEDLRESHRTAKLERDNPERPVVWRESMADVVNYIERISRAGANIVKLQTLVVAAREERDELRAEVAQLKAERDALQRDLRQERGLKALLANGMPPTGNEDFDKILATHPVAAMIQRGWLPGITGFDDLPALESAICHFWGVKTIAEAVDPKFDALLTARTQGGSNGQ